MTQYCRYCHCEYSVEWVHYANLYDGELCLRCNEISRSITIGITVAIISALCWLLVLSI